MDLASLDCQGVAPPYKSYRQPLETEDCPRTVGGVTLGLPTLCQLIGKPFRFDLPAECE